MLQNVLIDGSFEGWRTAARRLLNAGIRPEEISWGTDEQHSLLQDFKDQPADPRPVAVPSPFIELAETVACFDDAGKWPLLYRILYRLVHEDRHLLKITSDPDVLAAGRMEKGVKRDIHKFHAFVRFRSIACEGEEIFTAWYEPQHFTVKRAVPFFTRRFGSMRFSILTPMGCAHWDRKDLVFTPGVAKGPIARDETEEFWLTYYRSIFNPFRLKLKAMKSEMPVRHWSTLPEAAIIGDLIHSAATE